jgi:Na+-driven multidrug efflux pump
MHENSFKDLGYIVVLGWQSFRLKVMGWWAFDVFTQLAAQPPSTDFDLAAQTNLRNIGLYTYMIPVGFSSAINFFTGKYIGAGLVK